MPKKATHNRRSVFDAQKSGRQRMRNGPAIVARGEHPERHQQLRIVELFGTIEYDPSYDYKHERKRRSK